MKDKSIPSRFGLVVLVVLLLVLILPSSKIDLASKISASTQASTRQSSQNSQERFFTIRKPESPV